MLFLNLLPVSGGMQNIRTIMPVMEVMPRKNSVT
jgi:hypothetical protein